MRVLGRGEARPRGKRALGAEEEEPAGREKPLEKPHNEDAAGGILRGHVPSAHAGHHRA